MITSTTSKLLVVALTIATLGPLSLDAMKRPNDGDLPREDEKKQRFFGAYRDQQESSDTSSDSESESSDVVIGYRPNNLSESDQDILELTIFFRHVALENPQDLRPLIMPILRRYGQCLVGLWNRFRR